MGGRGFIATRGICHTPPAEGPIRDFKIKMPEATRRGFDTDGR